MANERIIKDGLTHTSVQLQRLKILRDFLSHCASSDVEKAVTRFLVDEERIQIDKYRVKSPRDQQRVQGNVQDYEIKQARHVIRTRSVANCRVDGGERIQREDRL